MCPPFLPPDRPRFHDLTFQYQPIRTGAEGRVFAFEALVRWALPDGTIAGPAEILPHYLSPQRIEAFTEFTIREAALLLARYPELPGVTVNLSPDQLRLPRTARVLEGLRDATRERLAIELTEDATSRPDAVVRALEVVRALGFRVLLDDVTPRDVARRWTQAKLASGVKLDRSVLPELLEPGSRAGRAAHDLLERLLDLGLEVVLEGVEDAAVVPRFEALGVRLFQGFGLGRPKGSPFEHPLRLAAAAAAGPAPVAPTAEEERSRPDEDAPASGPSGLRRLLPGG